jgi:hypothetical protein
VFRVAWRRRVIPSWGWGVGEAARKACSDGGLSSALPDVIAAKETEEVDELLVDEEPGCRPCSGR